MFRYRRQLLQKVTDSNTQQPALQIDSAYSLLRIAYRSIDICVKSRHARGFLKKRLIESWREGRNETNPLKQRELMERAGAFITALHSPKDFHAQTNPRVEFQLSRVVADKKKSNLLEF